MLPGAGGIAAYSHLKKVEEVTNQTPKELEEYYATELPTDLIPYWEDFLELSRRRSRNAETHNPITFPEISAWASLNGIEVTSFQLDVIGNLDAIWLRVDSEKD